MITIRQARQELFEVFAENKSGKPKAFLKGLVTRIFDHEPFGGDLVKPASITMLFAGTDTETESWVIELRIYVDASLDAKESVELLEDIIETIETTNTQHGGILSWIPAKYSKSEWQTTFEPELKAWGALTKILVGREDY